MTPLSVDWHSAGEHEVPAGNDWLSERERSWLALMRFPKRRLEYRMARWCGKSAIAAMLDEVVAIGQLEIGHLPEGAPAAYLDGRPLPRRISMTDRAGWAVCAVAPEGVEVGVDLELVEPRSALFVADYFTRAEAELAGHGADPLTANLIWSAKESALKVLRTGLRRDTRSVEIDLAVGSGESWAPFVVRGSGITRPFEGWWRRYGLFVITIVADAPTGVPRSLADPPGLAAAEPVHSWLADPGPIGDGD